MPFEGAFFAVDADVQSIFASDGDLAGPDNALGAIFEMGQDTAIVIEGAALDEGGEVGAELLDFEPGDVFSQIFSMRSDIPDATGATGEFGIRPPTGLFLTRGF